MYVVEAHMFCIILYSLGLTQDFNSAIHKRGHKLGLVISTVPNAIIVGAPSVFDHCFIRNKGKPFGEHLTVQFIIDMEKSDCIGRKIRCRKYRGLYIK